MAAFQFSNKTSYLNTKGNLTIGHSLNNNNTITLIGNTEKSNLSSNTNSPSNIQSFNKNLIGLSYTFNILEVPIYINRNKFNLFTGILIGNRSNENSKTNQNIFEFILNYTHHFNLINAIFTKTTTQILTTKNPFENEFFRIEGINSIRGFNELSILTQKYNVTNLEYHYTLNNNSFTYTITDFAILNNINTSSSAQLYGIGLGYYLNTKNTILYFSYAVGSKYNTPLNINNSKIHFRVTYPFKKNQSIYDNYHTFFNRILRIRKTHKIRP